MQRLSALACFCLMTTAWSAGAQAAEPGCPNLQAAADSVRFPQEASDLGVSEGKAVVTFTVRADGAVVDLAVASATHPAFGTAALSIASRLRCDRRATSVRMKVPVKFDFFGAPYFVAEAERTGCKLTLPPAGETLGFPTEALEAGLEQGLVVIDFKVDEEGRKIDIVVVESPHPSFSRVAYRRVELLDCKGTGEIRIMRMPVGFRLE